MSCFTQHTAPTNPCPVCGYNETAQEMPPHILRPRTILNGKYLLGKVLGQGGFGITYIGWDLVLDVKVAIKEYYPSGFVTREAISSGSATVQPFTGSQGDFFIRGREKFLSEARTLAKFFSLPGIVSIKDFFQENGTAYISMEYIDGQTLKDYLVQMGGKLPADQIFYMMKPVMSSLVEIHRTGLIHRDISPDNIMISKEGQMKLLDFGAARDFSDSGNKSMSIMLKPGFAPEEQYRSRGVQGPWTDIYALSATIYKCITGVTPEESVERVHEDQVRPPSMLSISVDSAQEAALMMGMAVLQKNRFQSVSELYASLYTPQTGAPAVADVSINTSQVNTPEHYASQAQADVPVSEATSSPTPFSTPATEKPKRTTKEKWIIAIACGVAAGTLSIALGMWQQSGNRADEPVTPTFSPPVIELPTPAPSDPTPIPTPESQSPKDTTHNATTQLRDFQHYGGMPDTQRGWFTDGVDTLWSPYTSRNFTDSRYLILEFDRKPYGDIEFAWIGDTNDWAWTVNTFAPQDRILIINLALINGYNQYIQASYLKIYVICLNDSWDDLIITDAYFANAR